MTFSGSVVLCRIGGRFLQLIRAAGMTIRSPGLGSLVLSSVRTTLTSRFVPVALFVLCALTACVCQTPPPVSFIARRDYAVGSSPQGIVVGDLNSDGNPDLVTVSYDGNVSVLLGNADGTFQPPVNYPTPSNSIIVQLGDFDGDGKLDIFVATQSTTSVSIVSVSVLLGNGDGTFQAQKLTNISNSNCRCVAVGDFNGDTKLDLAIPVSVPQQGDSAMTVMLGNGDGTFQAAFTGNPGPFPTPGLLMTADFNADGIPDLVSQSDVFLGKGDGTFQQPNGIAVHGNFVVADFTGDGKLDIASNSGEVAVLPGNGDGTFGTAILTDFGYGSVVANFDLNGDGKQDLVLDNEGIFVLLGNGDGTFQLPDLVTNLPGFAAVFADFNKDGKPDIASIFGSVSVAMGKGDGAFQLETLLSGLKGYPVSSLAADLTGDGKTDLLEVLAHISVPNSFVVLPGNGNGTFQPPTAGSDVGACGDDFGFFQLCPAVLGDLNGDGKLDAVMTATGASVGVFLGNGDGTFQSEVDYGGAGSSLALGDLNGDGSLDIVTSGGSADNLSLLFGKGDGTFGFPVPVPINEAANFVVTGDFNKDGHLDSAVATGSAVAILLGNGDGTFQPEVDIATPPGTTTLAVADFNHDGNLDLVAGNSTSNSVSVLLNTGSGTSFTVTSYSVLANVLWVAVGDFNGDGIPDLVVRSIADVSILAGNGDGTFQPAVNFGTQDLKDIQVSVADFNRDGGPDIAVGTSLLFNTLAGPAASLTPSLADFGNTVIGSTSGPQTVTLSNTGTGTLLIRSITLTGPQGGDFSQTNTCGAGLLAGQNCTFKVSFTPSGVGLRTATIQIADNAFNTPQAITLSGVGVTAAPVVMLTPTEISFGNQAVGISSGSVPVTLTNTGNASLTISSIMITGPQSSEFAETNTCRTNVAAGAKCMIVATFTPAANGSRSATLSVADNASGSPQTVAFTGVGVSLNLATSDGSATVTAGQAANYTLSIGGGGFSGTASLTCSGAPTGADCSVPASENVDANTAAKFTVTVTTTPRTAAFTQAPPSTLHAGWLWSFALAGVVILPGSFSRRRATRFTRGMPIILLLLLFMCSCGGSSNSTGGGSGPTGTPAGTYTLTVKATSGSVVASLPLTLIVQ
jgi:FG-GAP-like repeat/HYDIN/CFA65/VesB-like, Ig-like domain/Abnormal spindle-like microcephaly-assoc'd, ASPM-SPD-2-Hydin